VSVKKAFLDLDDNFDGFVEAADIIRLYGGSIDFVYADLKKIMQEKDTTSGTGRLNYSDFSKWMGGAIHQSEGFYFRHDSKRNPMFDRNQEIQELLQGNNKRLAAESLLQTNEILEKVIDKVRMQWKTVRKAFTDLN